MFRIELELASDAGPIARNSVDIAVFAAREAAARPVLAAPDAALAQFLVGMGYVVDSAEKADVVVKHALDAADIEAMRNGARYLVLADGSVQTNANLRTDPPRPEPPTMPAAREQSRHHGAGSQLPNIALHRRDGTLWRGDWIANFSWLRRDGAFRSLPGGPLLDICFDRVVPHHVMTGFRSWEYEGLVHAGVVIGWLHKPAATIAERQVGKGRLVATTFRLTNDAPGADPVAAALLDGLVDLVVTGGS
jgi:hypothetical protein